MDKQPPWNQRLSVGPLIPFCRHHALRVSLIILLLVWMCTILWTLRLILLLVWPVLVTIPPSRRWQFLGTPVMIALENHFILNLALLLVGLISLWYLFRPFWQPERKEVASER